MPKFFTFLIVFLVSSCSIGKLTKLGVYKELAPSEYLIYLEDSTVNIIDVRTESEYIKTHINGAVNASYFSGHFRKAIKSLELNKSLPTLIYCETQHRSLFAAKKLYLAGYKTILDLDRGMMHWRKNGFPFVGDTVTVQ